MIRLKRSGVAGKVPTTGDIVLGEVAINTHDGRVFFKKYDGADTILELATTGAVAAAIAGLIGGAPGQLDTLKELADAINDDANIAATLTAALALKAATADLGALAFAANSLEVPFASTEGLAAANVAGALDELAAAGGGDLKLLVDGSVTADVATIAIDLRPFTAYRVLHFALTFKPPSSNRQFRMKTSSNGGASFDATGYWDGTTNNAYYTLGGATSAQTKRPWSGVIEMHEWQHTNSRAWWYRQFSRSSWDSSTVGFNGQGSGCEHYADTVIDAVQFFCESGNILAGSNYQVYGLA